MLRGGIASRAILSWRLGDVMTEIRDFIFLDVERIRSFVAQLAGGFPTERSGGTEHEAGGQASAGGGIPLLMKVEGQVDYRWVRSETETRSVQDAIFEEFLKGCPPLDVASLGTWPDADLAPDGQVILVRGLTKLIDYESALEALRAFPRVMSAYQRFLTSSSSQPSRGRGQASPLQGGPAKGQIEALTPLIDGMSKLVGTNLSDFVRVKVVPDLKHPQQAFVGDGHRDSFRYPSAMLTTLYPRGLAAGWTCVGLVHRAASQSAPERREPTTVGDMLESLLDQMNGLEAFRQTARPPEISFTPLAIFRGLFHA
jgi:hypothetical protein